MLFLQLVRPTEERSWPSRNLKSDLSLFKFRRKVLEMSPQQRKTQEDKAVKIIKENPRYFYSYAKRYNKVKSSVGPLTDENGDLVNDPKTMGDLLQEQYSSVFSDPASSQKKSPDIDCVIQDILEEIPITHDDIIKAIDDINESSACGEDDIPAIILKKCKNTLSHPIFLIWEESLQNGYVPKHYKHQIITPAHKKASKAEAENYRPNH